MTQRGARDDGNGAFDPFGDYARRGYLRNAFKEKDPEIVKTLEMASVHMGAEECVRRLAAMPAVTYDALKVAHATLFREIYPSWAGKDRMELGGIDVQRGGVRLFNTATLMRKEAAPHLAKANDPAHMRADPGGIYTEMAFAHPFLEGNGRSIFLVHSELCRRAGIAIEWSAVDKRDFLQALTRDIQIADGSMSRLVKPHIVEVEPLEATVRRVTTAKEFAR